MKCSVANISYHVVFFEHLLKGYDSKQLISGFWTLLFAKRPNHKEQHSVDIVFLAQVKYELVQLCELLKSISNMRNLILDMPKTRQKCPGQLCEMFSWLTYPSFSYFSAVAWRLQLQTTLYYNLDVLIWRSQHTKNSTVCMLCSYHKQDMRLCSFVKCHTLAVTWQIWYCMAFLPLCGF